MKRSMHLAHDIIRPDGWPPVKGYANGIRSNNGTLYICCQIGWNDHGRFEIHDLFG